MSVLSDLDLAAARRLDPAEDVQKRGLAAPRGADDGHEHIAFDLQIHVLESDDFVVTDAELLA